MAGFEPQSVNILTGGLQARTGKTPKDFFGQAIDEGVLRAQKSPDREVRAVPFVKLSLLR
jgi:hypothetical protein